MLVFLKLLFPVFITGIQSEGIKVFVYMKVVCYFSDVLIFFLLLLWMFCFWVKRFYCRLCVASAVPLKLAKNVFLTDASSYLPRAVVGFIPRGRPPETCSLSSRPPLWRSPDPWAWSLMADKVKGHIWDRMDFPQLYTGVCTSTRQITTLIILN